MKKRTLNTILGIAAVGAGVGIGANYYWNNKTRLNNYVAEYTPLAKEAEYKPVETNKTPSIESTELPTEFWNWLDTTVKEI
jgi:hypothetical protein